MRRFPLWTTLIPLVAGLGVYWWYWDTQRDQFQSTLETFFGAGRADVGGFPYRLEAEVPAPRLVHNGQYILRASAEGAIVNRQPWRQQLTILRLREPRVEWQLPGNDALAFGVSSATAQSSLRLDGERIARLSTVYDQARVRFSWFPVEATAASFELHFRETPAAPDPASRAATFPEQAQIVMAGRTMRFGGGDPLTFDARIGVTSSAPVWSPLDWRRGGTAELRRLTLRDATGEVLSMSATLAPSETAPARLAGTIDTVCPLSVAAALAGTPAPGTEYRTRKPVRLAIEGAPGDLRLIPPTQGLGVAPVRRQEPACPALVR